MRTERCQVLIIGAGPGGYVCGIRAGQLGLDTIVVEGKAPGGTCLNVGCIPSKALIHAADEFHRLATPNKIGIATGAATLDMAQTQAWKDGIVARLTHGVSGLLKKAKSRLIVGRAQILDGKSAQVETPEGPVRIECENMVIASGSHPTQLSALPFGGKVISSTQALALSDVPKTLAVVGGGYIGLEIGTAMAKLGAQVTILEAADHILPQYDAALTKPVEARLRELGIDLHLNSMAKGLSAKGDLQVAASEEQIDIPADHILVAVGRVPTTQGFGLEGLALKMAGNYIAVDEKCQTSMRQVFAIGDVTGDPTLAHRAMAQGTVVAEHIAGQPTVWDKRAMPAVCFTDPEVVVVGKLPSDDVASAVFPLSASGRAMTMDRTDGFVRVVYDESSELVLGLQAVGAGASELAGEFSLAIEMCATLTDIAQTIHAHPTLGESVQEVSLMGLGQALHL
ncbi:MAG: dihydrolipoyl dehydrogenase [Pseudomonadota bacterium]